MALKHINAVIVGAGTGGGVVAKELGGGGPDRRAARAGRWPSFGKHDKDELSASARASSAIPSAPTKRGIRGCS